MGMVPNMYRSMANFPALLDTYQHGYQKIRVSTDQIGMPKPRSEVYRYLLERPRAPGGNGACGHSWMDLMGQLSSA